MKHCFKKFLSFLLCAIMLLGSVAIGGDGFVQIIDAFTVKASAASFTPRTTEPSISDPHWIHTSCGGLNECIPISGNSVLPNCVGYAWGRAYEILGYRPNLSINDAKVWYNNTGDGYARGSTPKLGAIACWSSGTWGHVAVVEAIESNSAIWISESDYGGSRFEYKKINPSTYIGGFQGYIYVYSHTNHDFTTSATIDRAPTPTSTGVRRWFCSCGESITETIPKINYINIEQGIYRIYAKSDGRVIATNEESNFNAFLSYGDYEDQYWRFISNNDGTYTIYNCIHPNKVLDVSESSKINGGNIQVCEVNGSDAQKFYVIKEFDYYRLVSKCSYMSVDFGGNNGNVQQWTTYDGDYQKWTLEKFNPQLNLSTSLLTKDVGTTDSIACSLSRNTNGLYISTSISNPSVCSCSCGSFSNNNANISISFTQQGYATITVYLKDSVSNVIYDTKTISVISERKYTVSYDSNGGKCDTSTKSVTYGSVYGDLPTPSTRQGFKFIGWYDSKIGGNLITKETKYTSTADTTLYAHWQHDTFKAKENENIKMNGKTIYGDNLLSMTGTELSGLFENSNISVSMKTDRISTGTTVNLIDDTNTVYDTLTVCIFGDTNCDGWYNGMDSLIVNCLANGMLTREQVGEAVYMAADCNHDGVIDNHDVELLQQAGVLLASVDQSKTQEELQTSSAYTGYLNLIDQKVDDKSDTPSATEDDSNKSESNLIFSFICDLFAIIKRILGFIQTIFA